MLCPYCKEEIADGAIKCKHCGSMLGPTPSVAPQTSPAPQPQAVQVAGTPGRENSLLMKMAWESLSGKWWLAIGATLLFFIIAGGTGAVPVVGPIIPLLIGGPLSLGLWIFFLSLSRTGDARIGQIFEGFNRFGTALGAYWLMYIFILLWTLLLIIPGIMAAFSYSLTYCIIADDPSISAMDAIDRSKKMMYGNRWKLFCLYCRFWAWFLLGIITIGIAFLWIMPYMWTSMAKFYDDLKAQQAPATVS